MPILFVFTLAAACLPDVWPDPLIGGGTQAAAALTAAAVAFSLSIAIAIRIWVVRTLRREPGRKIEVANTYSRLRGILFFVNVGLVAACILVFGWGWAVQRTLVVDWNGQSLLAPLAELAAPLPYFVILVGTWIIYFDAERALHRTTLLGPVDRSFFSRSGYLLHHARQFALLIMLPVLLFVSLQTVNRYIPELANSSWFRLGPIVVLPLVILLMPLVFKPLLGLKSMPPSAARDRLEAIASRLRFRCTDFLIWPTHGAIANAMILGLVPRVRYVIFTDRILDELPPDEVDAVFGHEIGHAKHGHIWLYAGFLALSTMVLAASYLVLGRHVPLPEWEKEWPPLVLAAAYVYLVFGFLSRRCERQADIYGCRTVSCSDPNCTGHDRNTVYPERARGLCPSGIRTFVRALERVDLVNGSPLAEIRERRPTPGNVVRGFFKWLRAWQHSTMSRRVTFLLGLIEDPDKERRFQRRVMLLRWGLLAGLAAALVALGDEIGWKQLIQSM